MAKLLNIKTGFWVDTVTIYYWGYPVQFSMSHCDNHGNPLGWIQISPDYGVFCGINAGLFRMKQDCVQATTLW